MYFVERYLAVVDPGGFMPQWQGMRYSEVGKAVCCANLPTGNATTRAVGTVSSGGSPTVESSYTSIDISSNTQRPGYVITSTGKKSARHPAQEGADSQVRDTDVDKDYSVVSVHMPEMAEEYDLRAA